MNVRTRMQLLALVAASSALLAAGCDRAGTDRTSTSSSTNTTAGQKMERSADKVGASTENAATKTANAADDAGITTKVKAAVMAEPGLKTLDIKVETKNGVVTLEGTVASPELKQRATQLAQQVEGVRSVSDQLVVKAS